MTTTFVFEAGAFRRSEARVMLQKLDFHNPGRIRWMEVKGLLSSEFPIDAEDKLIRLIENHLTEQGAEWHD